MTDIWKWKLLQQTFKTLYLQFGTYGCLDGNDQEDDQFGVALWEQQEHQEKR